MNSPWQQRFAARVVRPAAWLGVLWIVALGAVLGLVFNEFNPAGLRLTAAHSGQVSTRTPEPAIPSTTPPGTTSSPPARVTVPAQSP